MGCCGGRARRISTGNNNPVSLNLPVGASKLANGQTGVCTNCGSKMVLKQQYQISGRTYQQWRCQSCSNLKGIYL
jgi:DNA-directed RNA polymerase subunit RPC12/RpoP